MAKDIFYSNPNIIEASINLLSKKYINFKIGIIKISS